MRALDGEPARSFFVACFLLRRVGALRVVKSVGDEDGGVGWFGLRSAARRVLLGLRGRRRGQQVLYGAMRGPLPFFLPRPLSFFLLFSFFLSPAPGRPIKAFFSSNFRLPQVRKSWYTLRQLQEPGPRRKTSLVCPSRASSILAGQSTSKVSLSSFSPIDLTCNFQPASTSICSSPGVSQPLFASQSTTPQPCLLPALVLVDSRLHLLSDCAPPPLFNLGSFADCAHLRTPPFNRQSLTSQLERPSFLT